MSNSPDKKQVGQLILTGGVGVVVGLILSRFSPKRKNSWKKVLKQNSQLFNKEQKRYISNLVSRGYADIFEGWPRKGVRDQEKIALVEAARKHDEALSQYIDSYKTGVVLPPKAIKKPHKIEAHGDVRVDYYYWLRDDKREDKEVMEYIDAENRYTEIMMADTKALQENLFQEMKARIQETDQSASSRYKNYFYYHRTLEGKQYKIYCRRKLTDQQIQSKHSENDEYDDRCVEEVLLDANQEAKNKAYYRLGAFEVSPDSRYLAYSEDTVGNEAYSLRVKDLVTNQQILKRPIPNTVSVEWANDNKTLFYTTKDDKHRSDKLWRHVIGSDPENDQLVFHEQDPQFYLYLHRSRDDKLIFVESGSKINNEIQYIPADDPEQPLEQTLGRTHNVEYSVYKREGHFVYVIRDEARLNSEICVAKMDNPQKMDVLLEHRAHVKIESVAVSKRYMAVFERSNAQQSITIYQLPEDGSMPTGLPAGHRIDFDEEVYDIEGGGSGEYDSDILRFTYSSLSTPTSVIDYNMASNQRKVKKVEPVLGGFDASQYKTERLWATASHDLVKVPISLVYRKDLVKLDGSNPCVLDGYGSYEINQETYFNKNVLSYIDRGFVFAMAHVRGGGDMGRAWYENGKFLKKKNTFLDFIACAEHLIKHKYTSTDRLCATGRSAGGMLMGAVANMRPDLFKTIIADVPFVDVLTTILDATIPVTELEWDEWGNPIESKEYYDYIKSYSPMDNIAKQQYPDMLLAAGLHDPRVPYWEPLKFVAKLREKKVENNSKLLIKTEKTGHFSKSGRFEYLKEVAFEFAFVLKSIGLPYAK
eukprot:TRINITY_DN13183_c1_g1_i11.p1 TRINITY_DN13183_c1_g1~~TRINITY_DN13183_c1_g1_i11.p1  ORF type:complete len:816 (-),score=122.46 TRINITY_DN13183_c1_g1_i11:1786-4233(-)